MQRSGINFSALTDDSPAPRPFRTVRGGLRFPEVRDEQGSATTRTIPG